jgi:diacylglycerol kinase family enzyme
MGIKDLEEAWTALKRGTPQPMDVIRVECCSCSGAGVHYALSFAGVGIIAPLLRLTTPLAKKLLGQSLAYKFALLRALWSYTPPQMRITCDGKTSDGRFLFLGVSNGEHAGGGMRLAPGARIDDGTLDVNLVGAVGLLDGLSQIRRLARGRHTRHPQVRFFQSRSIGVEAGTRLEVALDGELVGYSPARFEVQPRALPIYRHP